MAVTHIGLTFPTGSRDRIRVVSIVLPTLTQIDSAALKELVETFLRGFDWAVGS